MRAPLLAALVFANTLAPLQCQSEQKPAERNYETPAEALYDLAQRFEKEGNERAWRETLEYLIEQYPNSRYAVMAKDDLGRAD